MNSSYRASFPASKFVAIYTKLLQGVPPSQLVRDGDARQLFSDLLDLQVDSGFLSTQLQQLSKDACLGNLKVRYGDLRVFFIFDPDSRGLLCYSQ